jgi:crotonobetainyl-CoA:carnitine CoA-transferase CaiB-like acyl-CoA transferase
VLSRYRRPYRTRDGYLAVLPYLDAHWRAFCALAGRADLVEDPRFATLDSRIAHIDGVYAETAAIIATRTTAEWLDALAQTDIPVTVVRSLDDLIDDQHLTATGFWHVAEHATEGRLLMPGIPTMFSETPGSIRRLPPRLGEHSVEVLREAGVTAADIEAMLATGATRQAD